MASKKRMDTLQADVDAKKKQRINSTQPESIIGTCCCLWFLLPLDIMADILSRLPAKSVAKFRCVCKRYLSLTHDPLFLKSHQERSSSYVVVGKCLRHGEIYKYSNIGDGKNSKEIYCKVKLERVYYQLSNFVDGLTCAYGYTGKSDLYLLNPMTRELQKLRKNNSRREYFKYENFGLGIDLTMGLCKIVRLFTCSDDRRVVQCEVYNVVTMQWRFLGEAPFELFNHSNSVFFLGALHWIGCLPGDGYQDQGIPSIYRFNIKDEKFEPPISLPCPPSPDMYLCPDFGLKELKGKFWLFYMSFDRTYCEIWTMKDYLNSAWVKEYKFHSNNLLSLLEVCDKEIVDNDILFRPYRCQSFAFYKESLISPKKLSKASRRRKK